MLPACKTVATTTRKRESRKIKWLGWNSETPDLFILSNDIPTSPVAEPAIPLEEEDEIREIREIKISNNNVISTNHISITRKSASNSVIQLNFKVCQNIWSEEEITKNS